MMSGWLLNHRGPYRFCLTRDAGARVKPRHRYTTEWLKGELQRDEVESDAQALIDDPRDTIVSVGIWSVSENQFIGAVRMSQHPCNSQTPNTSSCADSLSSLS